MKPAMVLPANMNVGKVILPNRCEKCKWSSPCQGSALFECRRYPPHAAHVLGKPPAPPLQVVSYYPQVRPDQHCGEFSASVLSADGVHKAT